MELPNKKYNIIYADPPWSYHDKCMHRGGAERHYNTMHLDDIKSFQTTALWYLMWV